MEQSLTSLSLSPNTHSNSIASQVTSSSLELRLTPSASTHSELTTSLGLDLTMDDSLVEEASQLQEFGLDFNRLQDQSPPITLEEFLTDLDTLISKGLIAHPPKKLKKKLSRKGGECQICCQTIHKKSSIYELKCRHSFHSNCLDSWRAIKSNCPLCRNQLL